MKRLYLLGLILAVFSANAANPLQDDGTRRVSKAVRKPQLARQNWSDVFLLKDKKTRIRHTPQMIFLDNVKRKSVNMKNQKYKGMPVTRGGLKLHVGMSRNEFIQALLRSGLYARPTRCWTDAFRLKNGRIIVHTPYWVEISDDQERDINPNKVVRLKIDPEGLDRLTLSPQGLNVNLGMTRNQFVKELIRSGAYLPPRGKHLQATFYHLKNGGYAIHTRYGNAFQTRGPFGTEETLRNAKSRAKFVNALKELKLYPQQGQKPWCKIKPARTELHIRKPTNRWNETFALNNGKTIRHTHNRLIYEGYSYERIWIIGAGEEVTVNMTRNQFVQTLIRAGLYPRR